MSKSSVIIVIILVAIVLLGILFFNSTQNSAPTNAQPAEQTPVSQTDQTPAPVSNTPAPAATTVSVAISGFKFAPATITINKGDTVTWTNNDSAPHTVTGDNGGPSSGQLSKGQSYSYTFTAAGTFPYHCAVHPMMTATVVVK